MRKTIIARNHLVQRFTVKPSNVTQIDRQLKRQHIAVRLHRCLPIVVQLPPLLDDLIVRDAEVVQVTFLHSFSTFFGLTLPRSEAGRGMRRTPDADHGHAAQRRQVHIAAVHRHHSVQTRDYVYFAGKSGLSRSHIDHIETFGTQLRLPLRQHRRLGLAAAEEVYPCALTVRQFFDYGKHTLRRIHLAAMCRKGGNAYTCKCCRWAVLRHGLTAVPGKFVRMTLQSERGKYVRITVDDALQRLSRQGSGGTQAATLSALLVQTAHTHTMQSQTLRQNSGA